MAVSADMERISFCNLIRFSQLCWISPCLACRCTCCTAAWQFSNKLFEHVWNRSSNGWSHKQAPNARVHDGSKCACCASVATLSCNHDASVVTWLIISKRKCALSVTMTNINRQGCRSTAGTSSFHLQKALFWYEQCVVTKKTWQPWDSIHDTLSSCHSAVAPLDFQTNLAAWQLHFPTGNLCAKCQEETWIYNEYCKEKSMKSTTDLADSGAQKKFLEVVLHPASQRFAWRTQWLLISLRFQFRLKLGLGSGGLVLTHYWFVLIYLFVIRDFVFAASAKWNQL